MTVTGDELRHIREVNRLREGAVLEITDGKGWVHSARIESCDRDSMVLAVDQSRYAEPQKEKTWLGISLLKGKAMHFVVERLTEIGIDRITPVIFHRTDVQRIEDNKPQKWMRIAEQAIKVSDNPWLPQIDPPVQLKDLLADLSAETVKLLLDLDGEMDHRSHGEINGPVFFLIGPPGGITDGERDQIKKAGFRTIRLSQWTFRSETAALYSAVWLKVMTWEKERS